MIDPRYIASGIQTGRSLAPQGPPIAEMLGMKMQQQAAVMEFMRELLKSHMQDVADLRKEQWNMKLKIWTNPDLSEEQKSAIEAKIDKIKLGNYSVANSLLGGGIGEQMGGGAEDFLSGTGGEATAGIGATTKVPKPTLFQRYINIPGAEKVPAFIRAMPGPNLAIREFQAIKNMRAKQNTATSGESYQGLTKQQLEERLQKFNKYK